MNRLKMAALQIAALPPGDRNWLVRRLPRRQRSMLRASIREALTLDPGHLHELLEAVLAANADPAIDPGINGEEIAPSRLSDMPVSARVLVIDRNAATWGARYVATLDPLEQLRLRQVLEQSGPRASDALVARLERHCRHRLNSSRMWTRGDDFATVFDAASAAEPQSSGAGP